MRTALLEAGAAFAASGLFVVSCLSIRVDPLDRLGQVSGLASLGLRFTLASLALVAGLLVTLRLRPGRIEGVLSVVSAVVAGLTSGFVAGGLLVALHGTPWCLFGNQGDAGTLAGFADWLRGLRYGQALYPYPPIPVHVLAWYGELTGLPSGFAMKHLQVVGTAAFGPVAYLSWRLLLPPLWALGVGVVAALPLIDPYKPYANLVLIGFVPLVIGFLQRLRAAEESSVRRQLLLGAAFGAAFGVLCLSYAGWFQWSLPGFLVAVLAFFPWRRSGRLGGVCLLAGSAAAFTAVCAGYFVQALRAGIEDSYVYFDVLADPAYVAMWRWDLPGPILIWPPLGELGGVGVFTVLLALGLGVAVALGQNATAVGALALLMASAWVMRFWFAHQMWETKLVQLYPRTSIQILYCLLVLCGYAVLGLSRRRAAVAPAADAPGHRGAIGAICGLLLVLGSASSAIANRYMPTNPEEIPMLNFGSLAWVAHHTKVP